MTAYCEHIFYQLNDLWIFGDENRNPVQYAYCKSAIDGIMSKYVSYDEGEMYRFAFDWSSDWEWGANPWTFVVDGAGQTPVEKLIGSGGIIDEKGGELYRNNFHFSINERMENAQDDAFDLRFGANMKGLCSVAKTALLDLPDIRRSLMSNRQKAHMRHRCMIIESICFMIAEVKYKVGTADGVDGNCDLDYSYVDYPAKIKEKGLNGYGKISGFIVEPSGENDSTPDSINVKVEVGGAIYEGQLIRTDA